MGYVYKITNKLNGKYYIGSSKFSPNENWTYYGSGRAILDAIKKYGKHNFIKEILIETKDEAKSFEKEILKELDVANDSLSYNMTNDALGSTFHSKKGRALTSKKLKGQKRSKETREKISKNKQGIKFLNGYFKVRKDKGKPRLSTKGRISPNQNKGYPIELYDNITNKYLSTYSNANRLAEKLNINSETIRQCLIGKQKTICNKNYYVKYKT
jgi:group I intron endonuclease